MKTWIVAAGVVVWAPAAGAQQAPPAQDLPVGENVTVTGEEREEVFKQQLSAERAAGEARKAFAGLKDGRGDAALGCRNAAEADREYAQAISEAQALAKDASEPLKGRLEQRIKGMKERRDNLDDLAERICGRDGLPRVGSPGTELEFAL